MGQWWTMLPIVDRFVKIAQVQVQVQVRLQVRLQVQPVVAAL
jgi:hypothetical protein